ncbi:MAG: pyridoxal phosphate-dependent aminotransferase family protein [Isosphaeraceae bacterium]|jgi:7-keto-8-aminopelargonate synthetase-like enzyme
MSTKLPIDELMRALKQNTLVRIFEEFEKTYPDDHLKDLVVDEIGAGRDIVVMGRRVTNFGSDSFLGLDQDPRVIRAIHRGLDRWGSHNGTSRAFSSVRSNLEAEEKLAAWLGVESTLIYPSVTLANHGAIPGLVGRKDVVVMDELAHNSIQEGARLAQAGGARIATFAHNSPEDLEQTLQKVKPYRLALICIDGVYSMSGAMPPMKAFNEIAISRDGVLYIDDAHGTGVLGERGRGTVLEALGSYDNAFVVGSLSKAFSCAGGFIACSRLFQKLLKIRSNTYIFGGPVVPAYLDGICAVVDILQSDDYPPLRARLDRHVERLSRGLAELDLVVSGGTTPILSVSVGDEADTLKAGRFLLDQGFYVQSVLFPAVPYHGGVIRVQCNANHTDTEINGLIAAFAALKQVIRLPSRSQSPRATAQILRKVYAYCADKVAG